MTKLHDIMIINRDNFDQVRNAFLIDLREDSNTEMLIPIMVSYHT